MLIAILRGRSFVALHSRGVMSSPGELEPAPPALALGNSRSDRRLAALLFIVAVVTYSWFFGGAGWNQDADFDLTRALVERRTLYIDGYDVNTGDVSSARGHTYINKPPGVSLLAAVPYAVLYTIERGLGVPVDYIARRNAWIVTALTCGLSGAAIGSVLFLYGRRRAGATAASALLVSLSMVFGTIVFAYSTMLFAQVPAALFLLLAVVLLRERPLLAGLAAGVAISCFYVCILALPFLAFLALGRSRREAALFLAGTLPIIALLGGYQWICFGSPLLTSVEASTFTERGLLLGVFRAPRLSALFGISISPDRGLFFGSPFLLFGLFGIREMARRRESRRVLLTSAAIAVVFFIVIASFNGWDGGWAFGPRYLLPVLPLFGIPLFYAARNWSRRVMGLFIAAAAVSVLVNFVATATDPMPAQSLRNPVGSYLIPAFFTGRISEETRAAFPWYHEQRIHKVALPRDSGNLGESLFGKGSRSSVLPIVAWMTGGTVLLFRRAQRIDRSG